MTIYNKTFFKQIRNLWGKWTFAIILWWFYVI